MSLWCIKSNVGLDCRQRRGRSSGSRSLHLTKDGWQFPTEGSRHPSSWFILKATLYAWYFSSMKSLSDRWEDPSASKRIFMPIKTWYEPEGRFDCTQAIVWGKDSNFIPPISASSYPMHVCNSFCRKQSCAMCALTTPSSEKDGEGRGGREHYQVQTKNTNEQHDCRGLRVWWRWYLNELQELPQIFLTPPRANRI